MSDNDSFHDISCSIKHFRKVMKGAMPGLRLELYKIIDKKKTDEREITYLLDTFIGLSGMGLGKEEFEQLNSYYSVINKKDSEEYAKIYREFNEESF